MTHAPTIAARAIRKLFEATPPFVADPSALCRRVGIDPASVEDPEARIPVATLHALWEEALSETPRDDAALVVASNYVPGDYALLGFVCMNSASMGEALGHVARYSRLWTDEPILEVIHGTTMRVRYRERMADRPGLRMATEATLAEVLQGARLLLMNMELAPVAVRFTHAPPRDVKAHRAFFGVDVEFRASATEMVFSAAQLGTSLPRADPQLGEYLKGLANDALARRGEPTSLLEQLRRAVGSALQKGVPDLAAVAAGLHMSERTLRRRLEEEGTTFRDLVDDVRQELARSYVPDRRFPLAEVAFLLGFSDQSTFHRAFKRWTGKTPASFRAEGT